MLCNVISSSSSATYHIPHTFTLPFSLFTPPLALRTSTDRPRPRTSIDDARSWTSTAMEASPRRSSQRQRVSEGFSRSSRVELTARAPPTCALVGARGEGRRTSCLKGFGMGSQSYLGGVLQLELCVAETRKLSNSFGWFLLSLEWGSTVMA